MKNDNRNILIFGMGAIGTYIGGCLLNQGAKVCFIEKGEKDRISEKRSLHLQLPDKDINLSEVHIEYEIQKVLNSNQFDFAILAVKSFDTQSIINSFNGIEDLIPPILCLQNGVENEDKIAAKIGKEKVISGTVLSAVGRTNNGYIKLERMRGIGIETGCTLSNNIIDLFTVAGLNAKGYRSRDNMKWSKMLTNLLANASSAILNWSPKQIFSHPLTYQLEVQQICETLEVMKALRYDVINLPGSPVLPLMFFMKNIPTEFSRKIVGAFLARARGAKMPSFHIDLYSGKTQSEVSYINGAVCRYGKKLNIATPVNELFTNTLEQMALGKIPKEKFADQPEKLYELLVGKI